MDLIKLAKECDDVIRPFGNIEVLLFYGIVARKLTKYLAGRELAAKNWLPRFYVIKRGSKEEPLYIKDFSSAVTPEFLGERKKPLQDTKLTKIQKLVWNYFLPRTLSDFFYATNGEKAGRPVDRIFFDLDRGDEISEEQALLTVREFVHVIEEDTQLENLIGKVKTSVYWTGKSFHVFLFLGKKKSSIYDEYFKFSRNCPEKSFTGKWADKVNKKLDLNVIAGHEKVRNAINIDPSQTPSGKLCRVPFSLHMLDYKTIDGVSIPLELKMLERDDLIDELKDYDPGKVIKDLNKLGERLP